MPPGAGSWPTSTWAGDEGPELPGLTLGLSGEVMEPNLGQRTTLPESSHQEDGHKSGVPHLLENITKFRKDGGVGRTTDLLERSRTPASMGASATTAGDPTKLHWFNRPAFQRLRRLRAANVSNTFDKISHVIHVDKVDRYDWELLRLGESWLVGPGI